MKSDIDTVISKETAKLFSKENYTYPIEYCWLDNRLLDINIIMEEDEDRILKAPSLSMILKFLREKRGIIITPTPLPGNKGYLKFIYKKMENLYFRIIRYMETLGRK